MERTQFQLMSIGSEGQRSRICESNANAQESSPASRRNGDVWIDRCCLFGFSGFLSSRTADFLVLTEKENYNATLVMFIIMTVVNQAQLCAFRIEVATYAAGDASESNNVDETRRWNK